jgi:hypothetical protein
MPEKNNENQPSTENKLNVFEQAVLAAKKMLKGVDSDYTVKMNAEACDRHPPESGLQKAICDVDKAEAQKRGLTR